MKKAIALLLVALTVFTLAGCGAGKKSLDLEKVKTDITALEMFPMSMELDDETLKTAYGVDPELLEQRYIVVSMMNVKSSMLWLLLPKEGKAEEVKTAMDSYLAGYEDLWNNYLPDQAELVNNRLETEIETKEGTWLLYCISEDNDKVLETINGALS